MFSPLENEELDRWFQRLNAPLKRLPAAERQQLHEEVRQHLDALVAANKEIGSSPEEAWKHALAQFGDPTRTGRRLYREWKQSRTGFRADISAIFYALKLHILIVLFWVLSGLLMTNGFSPIACVVLYLASFPLVCFFVGRRYPMLAIKGMFYASLLCNLWIGITYHISPMFAAQVFLAIGFQASVTYLASVTKRGWYRPTWEDFKLTLPKRRIVR